MRASSGSAWFSWVRYAREEPEWTRDLLLNLSGKLRKRTELARDHPDYLNPASFGNYFKPVKKLFDMNDIAMPWKRIYATYPELDNVLRVEGVDKGGDREDAQEHARPHGAGPGAGAGKLGRALRRP